MADGDIRVIEISKRRAQSPLLGWPYAIEFIQEGEPGEQMMWLDEFLNKHAGGVKVKGDVNE